MINKYISEMVAQEDKSTAEHSGRVAKIADILGRALSLSESELLTLDEAAKLHDVGKIKVDVKILQKPSRLTDEEFAEIKKHTVYGFAMISPKDDMIASLILSHHERWDGSGYPNGLSGCNIPYLSRVIAVADSIDAMCRTGVIGRLCRGANVLMNLIKTGTKCTTRKSWMRHLHARP